MMIAASTLINAIERCHFQLGHDIFFQFTGHKHTALTIVGIQIHIYVSKLRYYRWLRLRAQRQGLWRPHYFSTTLFLYRTMMAYWRNASFTVSGKLKWDVSRKRPRPGNLVNWTPTTPKTDGRHPIPFPSPPAARLFPLHHLPHLTDPTVPQ